MFLIFICVLRVAVQALGFVSTILVKLGPFPMSIKMAVLAFVFLSLENDHENISNLSHFRQSGDSGESY